MLSFAAEAENGGLGYISIFQQRANCSLSSGKEIMFQFLLKETEGACPSADRILAVGCSTPSCSVAQLVSLVNWIAPSNPNFSNLSFAELAGINPNLYGNRPAFKWKT